MECKIQTNHGVSKKTYKSTKTTPIHGQGQGSGHAGTSWVFNSVPMMKVIEKKCEGCLMNSPDKKLQWIKHLGFIDDKRQYANDWNNSNLTNALNKLQHAAQTWEHLLFTSGGKLEIDKCEAYIMSWQFNEDGIPKIINNNNIPSIIIQSSEEKMNREIKIHNSDIPSKYLGSTSSIDGKSIHQFQLIKKDAHDGTNTLTTHPFIIPQAILYLNCHLNLKFHYPLSSSTISNEQAKQIHKAHIPSAKTHGPMNLHLGP